MVDPGAKDIVFFTLAMNDGLIKLRLYKNPGLRFEIYINCYFHL